MKQYFWSASCLRGCPQTLLPRLCGSSAESQDGSGRNRGGPALYHPPRPAASYDTQPERRWEFIPPWGIRIQTLYCSRRAACSPTSDCGLKVESMPWDEEKHAAARASMVFLSQWARPTSCKRVARVVGLSWEMVYQSVPWVVALGLEGIKSDGSAPLVWTNCTAADAKRATPT